MSYEKNVSVVIPASLEACGGRREVWEFLKKRWVNTYPDWELIMGECSGDVWRKGVAISNGVEKAKNEIVIIADADSWVVDIHETLKHLSISDFVKPFNRYAGLTKEITERILRGEIDLEDVDIDEEKNLMWPLKKSTGWSDVVLGGIVVSRKSTIEKLPFDHRFHSWGGADKAWMDAVVCLIGTPTKAPKDLVHLWHPPAGKLDDNDKGRRINENNSKLMSVYLEASKNPKHMSKVVEEGKQWSVRYNKEPKIPKIIHQVWVGNKNKRPKELMETWKIPGWKYILWTEKEIEEFGLQNKDVYDFYYREENYAGASDIVRLEVVEKYGGVYIDADTMRLENIDDLLTSSFFAVKEDASGRIANGFIGSVPNHPVLKSYMHEIGLLNEYMPPWSTVGGTLFTRVLNEYLPSSDIIVLETYTFMPFSRFAQPEESYGLPYASHLWGTTKSSSYSYEKNNHQEPLVHNPPKRKTWKQRKRERLLRKSLQK